MKKTITLFVAIAFLAVGFTTNAFSQKLVINEFMASNDVSYPGPEGDYPDWIEIYNPNPFPINLAGWYMCDDLVDTAAWFQIPSTFPDSVTVEAGGYILFYANKGQSTSVLNLDFKLGSGGEQVGLWDTNQVVNDSLTYGAQTADTSEARQTDASMVWVNRLPADISPMTSNNPSDMMGLVVNEFLASNDASFAGPEGDYPDWIEIYNPNAYPVMLGGYYLSDDLADSTAMFPLSTMYPDSVTIGANDFILFYANKGEDRSVMNLDFKLSGGGEQVGFWNPQMGVLDTLTYEAQDSDTSYGRATDGASIWVNFWAPTPDETNANGSVVSVKNLITNGEALNVFPNPTNGTEVTLNKVANIQVYSITGQNVYSQNNTSTLDVSNFHSGVYFIRTEKGEMVKLIIK
jgi:hypothetical protein